MSTIAHLIKSFTLWEFVKAHALTFKYFWKPKATMPMPLPRTLARSAPSAMPATAMITTSVS